MMWYRRSNASASLKDSSRLRARAKAESCSLFDRRSMLSQATIITRPQSVLPKHRYHTQLENDDQILSTLSGPTGFCRKVLIESIQEISYRRRVDNYGYHVYWRLRQDYANNPRISRRSCC